MFEFLTRILPQYAECDGRLCLEILPLEFMTKIDIVNSFSRTKYFCPECMKEMNIPKEEKITTNR